MKWLIIRQPANDTIASWLGTADSPIFRRAVLSWICKVAINVRRDRTNNPATGIKGRRHGPPANDEAGHFEFCPICGQTFDMRNLGEVLHHHLQDHEPLKLDG
jgi:hypothetical protein